MRCHREGPDYMLQLKISPHPASELSQDPVPGPPASEC